MATENTASSYESEDISSYIRAVEAKDSLFLYICNEVITRKDVVFVPDITSHFEAYMLEKEYTVDKTTKKGIRNWIREKFSTSASIFPNNDGRLVFLPNNLSREELAVEVIELRKQLKIYQQPDTTEKSIDVPAETI